MEIRKKITYQFVAIVAFIQIFSLFIIYFSFNAFRKEEFNERLENKAKSIGQLIAETEHVSNDLLQRIELNNPTSLPKERVIVLNDKGEIIYSLGENDSLLYSKDIIDRIKRDQELYFSIQNLNAFGYYYAGSKLKIICICASEDIFGLRKLSKLRLILLFVFLFSVVLVYFLGKLFASRSLKPISKVVDQVNNIDITTINSRVVAGSGRDEIAVLADTFNQLLDRLETSIQLQKDFISNSSHELRTPLTVITGQLEVALMKERDSEEYRNSMVLVLDEIKRLNSLTDRLLTLSRTLRGINGDLFSELRFDEILWRARAEVIARNKQFTINIFFDDSIAGEHHFNVLGNRQLLEIACSNLLENGCKYSQKNEMEVFLFVKQHMLEVSFRDNGIGIPEDEIDLVFQPFFRGSNIDQQDGHGIGLSLVESIIKSHNGTIHVESVLNAGSEFRITIPLL